MSSPLETCLLENLDYIPYLDDQGQFPEQFSKKIGVYAIFNENKTLQLVHYSRDIYLSLKQHMVRQPQGCYWVKAYVIDKPNRSQLEQIKEAWITENGSIPQGNDTQFSQWTDPIDATVSMTDEEKASYETSDELGKIKLLKTVARRVQEEILARLEPRKIQDSFRFNPKLKEKGLLDLK
ncbi:GIY-YIG nuclease family protein [Roseofilum reptotaenium CS-1145]|uniref:Nuclease subunit of the excinuclease complex n=1 Tax=Roseofilum reptotaenium AO1-A TaxID=1925591 RepID=A0A1L9QUS8_9CYAN|nr:MULTISPECIES: GIY-YIG nuclease family protein [Roseofilum]MBP0026974.1 GIY-YIG nuclease family protein [Roseofilum sp. Guam]MDB9517690.1 GIY-YIG nuclease family protein [Roseofilum reptotaenium CS-1145]OJJ26357.1 Nuclease subunit of the excinuclease complex [Roseofilum reptotaenium AO1-A]